MEADYKDRIVIKKDTVLFADNLLNIPSEVSITTISFKITFDTMIDIKNIYKFYPLNDKNFKSLKTSSGIKSIIEKPLKDNKVFSNQITTVLNIYTDESETETKDVNVKIFSKGTLQVSGCINVFQADYSIKKIIKLLKGSFYYYVNDSKEHIDPFDEKNHTIKKIKFFKENNFTSEYPKFTLINSKFTYNDKFNLEELHLTILKLKRNNIIPNNVSVHLDLNINSTVSIYIYDDKFNADEKDKRVNINIYESGSILLQSCRSSEEITKVYNFIKNILDENIEFFRKKDIYNTLASNKDLIKYIDMESLSSAFTKYI